jgi:RNA-directed DNA polymerase
VTITDTFFNHFSIASLTKTFSERIIYSRATGIDNLDQYAFRAQLNEQIEILNRKASSGTYKFTKYKLKLVSKGRNKVPREISIPTIRDRIALRSLCNFLTDIYRDSVEFELPQAIIKTVKCNLYSGQYDACIKLDVENFYPTIKHKELISRLGRKIRSPNIKQLILSAISSPTVIASRLSDRPNTIGVPQGLSVSNILAAIYLSNIDKRLKAMPNIEYYRYVDDILIFCNSSEANDVANLTIKMFRKIGLKVHDPIQAPDKSSIGPINSGFDYLGYQFLGDRITARIGSIERLKNSLVSIFTSYKYSKQKSEGFLLWRLNLRITGCIFENKSKGWLFFFAEINDESFLHTMDHYVERLRKRFNVSISPKKFVRAFKELSHRKYETNYIPNFDIYDIEQMKIVLVEYFGLSIDSYGDKEIEFQFKRRLSRQVRDLEMDIMDFSYSNA